MRWKRNADKKKRKKIRTPGLGYTNHTINAVELLVEFNKAVKTGNWRPFFVKATAITAGMAAVALTAFSFSLIIGGPVGMPSSSQQLAP